MNYICNSVQHTYCKRLKYILDRSVSTMEIDSLTNAQVAEALSASFSCETSDFLFDAEKVLTEKERKIIALLLSYGADDSYAIYFLHLFEIQETPQGFYFRGKSEETGLYLVSEIRRSVDNLLWEEVL